MTWTDHRGVRALDEKTNDTDDIDEDDDVDDDDDDNGDDYDDDDDDDDDEMSSFALVSVNWLRQHLGSKRLFVHMCM